MQSIETRTFNYLDEIEHCRSIEQLASRFTAEVGHYGLTNFLITHLPPQESSFEPSIVHCAWPAAWREHYFYHYCWKHDPVAARVLTSRSSFLWSEVDVCGRARNVMDAASSYSLRDGLTIPFSSAPGTVSCISMAGRNCRFPPKGRRAVELMATYTHMKALQLSPLQWSVAPRQSGSLSPRERECLRWVASGKSDWEIGTILSISERTARQHVENATRKLGCVNRPQAVAIAIAAREINI